MNTKMQTLLQRIATSAKTFVRTMSRVMAPAPGKMPVNSVNINALLLHLCDFDQQTYRYVTRWLAYPLQKPGAKMQHALIINGAEGTGKSLFFGRVMATIYGDAARLVNSNGIDSRFNEWASGARFVVSEGRLTRLAGLKALIAGDQVQINQKHREPRVEPNTMNFVFVTSSPDFLPLSLADRRFVAVEAPPAREALFYKAVAEEIANGGAHAFRAYLMGLDLADFNQFSAPPRARAGAAAVAA